MTNSEDTSATLVHVRSTETAKRWRPVCPSRFSLLGQICFPRTPCVSRFANFRSATVEDHVVEARDAEAAIMAGRKSNRDRCTHDDRGHQQPQCQYFTNYSKHGNIFCISRSSSIANGSSNGRYHSAICSDHSGNNIFHIRSTCAAKWWKQT